jgi:serine phosphatase RsbU (regulator of sigma subunit)
MRTRDGRIWFATSKGVVVIDPTHTPVNRVRPPVVVEDVLVDGKAVNSAGWASPMVFAPGSQKFDFHYTANTFVVPKKVKFKYRLEGFDRNWLDAGTERSAHYTNLPPQKYTFRVIACNSDGLWNETGASFAFTLLPRFFQTWWFRGLEGLAVLGLLGAAFALQRRRLDARKAEELRWADHERKTEELETARRVQLALLPKESLTVGAFTVAGRMQTATEVGGDYFGYVETGGRLCVVVGDATGHGMASGLVAGMLKAVLASLAHKTERASGPAIWLDDLNTALRNSIAQRGLGVCLGIVLVDVESGEIELGMAGIPHPFHITAAGVVERLPLSGTPLGYLKKIVAATATRTLAPGERLVLMSDGLIEQVNGAGDEWGYAGVEAALAALCATQATPEEIAEGLLAACEVFGTGQPRSDDRTVVVLARSCTGVESEETLESP